MWAFSVLFLICFLVTIIGLVLLMPKKTRKKGKQLSIIFFTLCLLSYAIARIGGTSDQESKKSSDNTPVSTETSSNEDNTKYIKDTPMLKSQYQRIKIGMTVDQVKKIAEEPQDKTDSTWNYTNSDSSSADVTFDDKSNKVTEKSEIGILSDSSETITDKNGTRKDDRLATSNSEYADDVSSDAENTVGNIEWDGKKKDVVRKIEVNDNLGKNDGSKLILMYLNAPITGTNKAITDIVNQDTLKIAKSIKDDSMADFKIDSMTFFWYLPLTDQYGNTKVDVAYKVELENGTLKKINFSHLNDVDLPTIADQYNVTYKQ